MGQFINESVLGKLEDGHDECDPDIRSEPRRNSDNVIFYTSFCSQFSNIINALKFGSNESAS